jgi:hypothetical protein
MVKAAWSGLPGRTFARSPLMSIVQARDEPACVPAWLRS